MSTHTGPALCWCEVDGPSVSRLDLSTGTAVVVTQKSPFREDENQDAVLVRAVDGRRAVLAVADGAGGLPAGAKAARLAVEAITAGVEGADGQAGLRSVLLDAFERANEAVLELKVGAATTLAAVEVDGPTVRAYHVGDSAIVVTGQRGRLKLATVAHSPTGYLVEAGALAPDEAHHHEETALVLNVVGSADMRIELGSPLELAPFDTVLVCSDGVLDNLTMDEIVEIIRRGDLEACGQALLQAASARMRAPAEGAPSKPDDLSFVLYRPSRGRAKA